MEKEKTIEVTIELPEYLVKRACEITGRDTTETMIMGLKEIVRQARNNKKHK